MNWIALTSEEQLNDIKEKSSQRPQVIFKHSTRCSISAMAKSKLDRSEGDSEIDFYYLDLLRYRSISNKVSEIFNIYHESPQVLVIKDGACVYDESHLGISMSDIVQHAA